MKRGKVMKKKSRFLTGLLSAVMALSLFALPAAAEGNAMRVATLPDIETNKTGTVTIIRELARLMIQPKFLMMLHRLVV